MINYQKTDTRPLKRLRLSNLSIISTTHGTSGIKASASNKAGKLTLGGAGGKASYSVNYGYTITASATNPFAAASTISAMCWSKKVTDLVMAATDGASGTTEVGISEDGGVIWTLITNPFGASAISKIDCDDDGIFHICATNGKYAKSTTSAALELTDLIDIGATNYILDNVLCISPNIIMVSGHSAKLFRSTASGDAGSWSAIANPFVAGDNDALWCLTCDNAGRVTIGCYESTDTGKRGMISTSADYGINFGPMVATAFTEIPQRMIRFEFHNGIYIGVGDGGIMQYSFDLIDFTLIKANPFIGGIVYGITDIGNSLIFPGATGRVARAMFDQ